MTSNRDRKPITLRMPKDMDNKVTTMAQKMGVSKNAYILMLIAESFADDEQSTTDEIA